MTPLGHTGVALLCGIAASKFFPSLNSESIIAAVTIGGVFPDWDVFYYNIKTRSKFLGKNIGQHRFQITHTPFFMLVMGVILSQIPYIWFFVLGTIIHLLVDMLFFPEGVVLLYPVLKKSYNLALIKSPSFWAPKPISGVDRWHINYLTSPLFWISEVTLTMIAAILYFSR